MLIVAIIFDNFKFVKEIKKIALKVVRKNCIH